MKSKNIKSALNQLKQVLFNYQASTLKEKETLLKRMAEMPLNKSAITEYHECLLFISAYPQTKLIETYAQKELLRISNWLKNLPAKELSIFNDSGLPYTNMITRFSTEIIVEMIEKYACKIEIDSFEERSLELNTLFNISLPSVLKQETTAGLDNNSLLDLLGVNTNLKLNYILNELKRFENQPLLKDHLWESLKIYLKISNKSKNYARTFNRLSIEKTYYHNEIIKQFDAETLLKTKLPEASNLSETQRGNIVAIIRKSLLLTMRETDTATFMDETTLKLFHLERGVSIAIYGMIPERQLPYQSYIGYTAFKNGYPVAYGGSWIFGYTAMFGLNILDTFRGGESGYIMCQLLRTYIDNFNLNYIEIESYQFGKDNPDGIKSGAFWFYYRFGFRPIDKKLYTLAKNEHLKIKQNKNYRSSEKTLIELAESNLVLSFNNEKVFKKEDVLSKVLNMIAKDFQGNHQLALKAAAYEFKQKVNVEGNLSAAELKTFEELALWAKAFKIGDVKRLQLLSKMISLKSKNPYDFNKIIQQFSNN
jgi:hypothetical protein